MLCSQFPPELGGVGTYVYNLSKTLVDKGHTITVITPKRRTADPSCEQVNGITIFRVPFFRLYPFHIALLNFCTNKSFHSLEHTFTIVHSHTPKPLTVKTCLPVLTTVHTPMGVDGKHCEIIDLKSMADKLQSTIVYPHFEHELFNNSKQVTAVSRTVALELEEYGLDPAGIPVIGNGVDEKIFTPSPNKSRASTYVLYTGGLRARKGLFDFIKCAQIVCREREDVRFVMCGNGPFLNRLNNFIRELRLQKNVTLLGYVPQDILVKTYQEATVQLVPSHYEGLPTVLLEAMSCGLPVVATDIGGNNEVISSGVNGLLVPPKCPGEMAKAVLQLLGSLELRERLGQAARRTIEEQYTWNKIADRVILFYENLLKNAS